MCAALFGLIAVCSTIVFSTAGAIRRDLPTHARGEERRPLEKQVQIAVRRGDDAGDARDGAERLRQLLRDRPRRLAQRARQLEGDRDREIAERARRRHLDGERRHLGDAELLCGSPR